MADKYLVVYKFLYRLLMVCGVWLEENTRIPLWFRMYSILVHTIMGLHNMALIMNWIKNSASLRSFASSGYIIVSCTTGQIKMLLVMYNRKSLLEHVKLFDQQHFATKNEKEVGILNQELSYFRKSSHALLVISYASVVFLIILPYFWDANNKLPFPAWYPFNVSISPLYEVVYVHHSVVAFFSTSCYMLVDVLLSGSLIYIGLQCLLLCERVQEIGQGEVNNKRVLISCTEHYKNIVRFLKGNDKLFGRIYFWQLIASTTTLCLNLFLMSLTNPKTFEFTYLAVYQVAIGNLLLVPCLFATEMSRKSECIPHAAYSSNWIDAQNSFKKDLSFFILMSQKPLKFYAVNFFEISVVTFVGIYRAAMGYYAVLNNVSTGENGPKS